MSSEKPKLGAKKILAALSAGVALGPLSAHAANPADGRLLASQCAQCHGTNGNSAGGFPSLAGEEFFDLRDEMLDMMRPSEVGEIMKHQAKGYTPAQISLLASYFASLPSNVTGGGGK